jgi:hypothetical protein
MAQGAQKPMVGGVTISQLPHPKLGESRRLHGVKNPYHDRPSSVWSCACGCDVKVVDEDAWCVEMIQRYGAPKFYADGHVSPNPDKGIRFLPVYDPDRFAFRADPPEAKTVQAKGSSGHVTEGTPVDKEPAGEKTRWANAAQKLYDEGRVHVGVDYGRDVGQQESFEFIGFDPEESPTGRAPDACKFALHNLPARTAPWRDLYRGLHMVEADAWPFMQHGNGVAALRDAISERLLYGPRSERRQSMFTRKDLEHANEALRDSAGLPTFANTVRDALARMRQSLPAGVPSTALKLQLSCDEENWVDADDALISLRHGAYPLGYRFARLAIMPPPWPHSVDMDLQIDENGDLKTVVSDTHYGEGSAALAAALGFGK